jgi:hypothetical protein
MPGMGVVDLCLQLLDNSHTNRGVQHAAACVLQMLTIADVDTIKAISDQHALSKLVTFLYGKHRSVASAAACCYHDSYTCKISEDLPFGASW